MSDNLTVFSTNYTGVTGIKAKGTGNGTLTYIRPTGTKSITENGTGIDVTQYASVDVAVPTGGNVFVVTLSYNESTEMWEPDKTYAEVASAYNDNNDVTTSAITPAVSSSISYDELSGNITYAVFEIYTNTSDWSYGYKQTSYIWTSSGITVDLQETSYVPSDATAASSDVTQGKIFYNASGRQVGTYSGSTPTLQSKSVSYTPSETAQSATVTADSGYDGLSQVDVSVGAISSTYVGSGITQRSSSDLMASGISVLVPAGYYSTQAQKAVAAGSQGTPTATKGTVSNHSIDVTPSVTNTAGYIHGGTKTGTAVTISASELVSDTYTVNSTGTKDVTNYANISVPSGSATAPASITGTTATVSTGTNTLTLTKSVSVTPSVTAGYVSSGTAGDSSISLTANVTTIGAQTITPSTSTVSLQSGTYLTGLVQIKGDADLVASNIISTANIFGVQGSVVVQNYYTGSSAPSSSLGQNGDIYIQQ